MSVRKQAFSHWKWTRAAKVIEWQSQEHSMKGEGRTTGAFLWQYVLLCLAMAENKLIVPRVQCDQCKDPTHWNSVIKTTHVGWQPDKQKGSGPLSYMIRLLIPWHHVERQSEIPLHACWDKN